MSSNEHHKNSLSHEYDIWKCLVTGKENSISTAGFPNMYYYGREYDYEVIIMDLLGPSLEDLICVCGGKLSLKSILLIADQAVILISSAE